MKTSAFPELGFYLLPGHTQRPRDVITEVVAGEALGFGSAWLSERLDVKEAGTLIGAASAVTERIVLGTAATNVNTRHPMVTAAMATTASRLSGGRFALGVARGVGIRSAMWNVPEVTNAHLRDFAEIMRQLFRGERVSYDGPLGSFPYLHLADYLHEDIPLLFAGFGEKSLEAAGAVFDGVVLHTFLGEEAVGRCVAAVRRGAERAGRDPSKVKVWSVVAVACDPNEESVLRKLVARLATYMQAPGYGDLLVSVNRWDAAKLDAFRNDDLVCEIRGGIDGTATLEQLRDIAKLVPDEWMHAAVGDAGTCARHIARELTLGVDGVILHASTATELAPVIAAYADVRDGARFAGRTNRPA